eukprot:785541_1
MLITISSNVCAILCLLINTFCAFFNLYIFTIIIPIPFQPTSFNWIIAHNTTGFGCKLKTRSPTSLFDGHIISKCTKSTQNIVSFLSQLGSTSDYDQIHSYSMQSQFVSNGQNSSHFGMGEGRMDAKMETYHRTAQNNRIA